MAADAPAPPSPRPPRAARIRRDFVKLLLIVLGSTLLVIVLVRHLSHEHLTAAERRQRAQWNAAAKEPAAQPDALARQLAEQRQLAEARRQANAPAIASSGAAAGLPKGPPPGFDVPGADDARLSAQDRLALQKQAEQMDSQTLVAYEDTAKSSNSRSPQATAADDTPDASAAPSSADGRERPGANTSAAQRNTHWLADRNSSDTVPLTPVPPASPYMVMAGTPITTVLLGGLNSDLPGTFRALVDHDIYDSLHGDCALIPKGTRILGVTNPDVAIGQSRLLLAGTRMIWPNGASLSLTRMAGADPSGEAGLSADVNNHFFKIFGSTLLIGGVAAWVGQHQGNAGGTTIDIGGGTASDLSSAAAQALSQTTQTLLQRNMNIQPTLSTAPGRRMVIVTTRDMTIPPRLVQAACDE